MFLAVGAIQFGSNNGATSDAPLGSPNRIFAMSMSINSSIAGGPAINLGNGGKYTVTGSAYAPNGLIHWGGQDVDMNGSIVANEVFLSNSPTSTWMDHRWRRWRWWRRQLEDVQVAAAWPAPRTGVARLPPTTAEEIHSLDLPLATSAAP